MKIRYALLYVGFLIIVSASIWTCQVNTYDRVNLRKFNKLNNTEYTLDEWTVYSYDIKALHPFVDYEVKR